MFINEAAEQVVIGSILLDGGLMEDALLFPVHFSNPGHRRIYEEMKNIHERNEPVTILTVTTELKGEIGKVGGVGYLAELAGSIATTTTFRHDQRLVLDAYRHRALGEACTRYMNDPTDDGIEELYQFSEKYRKLSLDCTDKQIEETLLEIVREMDEAEKGKTGYGTGNELLDIKTGGIQPGDLVILAARPSMGKTAYALHLAANHCEGGGSVQIFSLEMAVKPLLQRMISADASVNGRKWRSRMFSDSDYEGVVESVGRISEWELDIHTHASTYEDIHAHTRAYLRRHKPPRPMIIIDYLQLMSTNDRHERRDLEIGHITRSLKKMAVKYNIPIILLSQLSRQVDQRREKPPLLSDLRESGNIEQDADMITFLYQSQDPQDEAHKDKIHLHIGKHRNGPVGDIPMYFRKEFGRFEERGEGSLEALPEQGTFLLQKKNTPTPTV
ncbi:replicative DNA helicase [Halobacillus sp. ACCC02827]|uniref:replicative DNA helicase n=1 Tax=Halobacillus sp. ACCC02827 TaxID=3052090 RepID=UPI00256FD7AD|nr:replicative DNA helicase [Halobacillus sp. ACCC02827]WJE15722.1 replicative DNA helicase [Halobacillus sp. ACCC02827]